MQHNPLVTKNPNFIPHTHETIDPIELQPAAKMCNREAQREVARPCAAGSRQWTAEDESDEAPVWTFRVMVLGCTSFLLLLVVNKYLATETSECIMGMALTIVVVYPLGYLMGKLIPRRVVYYPMFGLEFCTNEGPFGFKEYALISIFANLGATIGGLTSSSIDMSYI